MLAAFLVPSLRLTQAQAANQENLARQIQQSTDAMAKVQAQLEQSQQQLDEMRKELGELQRQMPRSEATAPAPMVSASAPGSSLSSSQGASGPGAAVIQDVAERQAVLNSEIATQEQTKVESESKYPVKITGMLLLNGFVNTSAVDVAANPAVGLGGAGSAGANVRQTMLGLDARGPHLFGARSFADLRMDFFGSPAASGTSSTYSGYFNTDSGLLRLRTAHAGLHWDQTDLYFALDRPITSPDTPASLTAVALPALAWSGNLWTWNPQVGITQKFGLPESSGVQLQAAVIDVGDAPFPPSLLLSGASNSTPPSSAEQSSRPGVEARVALLGSEREDERSHVGAGGYFARHLSSLGYSYDSWAATLDTRLLLLARLQFSGSAYRGLALGGMGGGGYKDFAYSENPNTGGYYFRPLDDVGGWAQLKEKVSERLEFNGAYGMDDVFAGQLRRYFVYDGSMVQNLARNRTFTGNVIYSPSAYLLFSLEYRRLESAPGRWFSGREQHHRPGRGVQVLMNRRALSNGLLCAVVMVAGLACAQDHPAEKSSFDLRLRVASSLPGDRHAPCPRSSGLSLFWEHPFFPSFPVIITPCCRKIAPSFPICRSSL